MTEFVNLKAGMPTYLRKFLHQTWKFLPISVAQYKTAELQPFQTVGPGFSGQQRCGWWIRPGPAGSFF